MKSGRADLVLLAGGCCANRIGRAWRHPPWATGMLLPGQFNTAEQGEHFGSCLPIQRRTSCCAFGSRRLLTPSPSNRSGRETSLSRPSRKQPRR